MNRTILECFAILIKNRTNREFLQSFLSPVPQEFADRTEEKTGPPFATVFSANNCGKTLGVSIKGILKSCIF